jgi:O-antigen ligase
MVAFVVAGLTRCMLGTRYSFKRFVVVSAVSGTLLTFFFLNLGFNQSWATGTVGHLRRGQDAAGLSTLTGRTLIWRHAIGKTLETPIFGHGYGISRLTMGQPRNLSFQPQHCHNALLEVFFTTGFVGLVPFTLLLFYSLHWIMRHARLSRVFSVDLSLHAAGSLVALLLTSLFEANLSVRLSLIQPLFFYYVLALDREAYFARLSSSA